MSNPITPAGLKGFVPAVTAKVCDALVKALLGFPATVYRWYAWAFNADATASDEFKADVNYIQIGDIVQSARPSATRTGFLLCGGQAMSRVEFKPLFDVIGTTYGAGDGFNTFNLPDIAGRVVVGSGAGAGLTARTLGSKFGEEGHVQLASEVALHSHTYHVGEWSADGNLQDGNEGLFGRIGAVTGDYETDDNATVAASAANVCQPSIVLHSFIKT